MTAPESISGPLRGMTAVFESCVLWAARAILESEVRTRTPFECVAAIPEGSTLYCILPAANSRYYAQLVVGLEEGDLSALFPKEPEEKVRKAAVGEMANVISGLFMAHEQFTARFGELKLSTPFFSEGAFTARTDWGLRGRVEAAGTREIALQITLRELGNASAGPEIG